MVSLPLSSPFLETMTFDHQLAMEDLTLLEVAEVTLSFCENWLLVEVVDHFVQLF